MRGFFSSPVRWLTVAAFGSRRRYSRRKQAEFPVTHQSSYKFVDLPSLGRCATGRASIDALRCTNNSVNIEDPHEISFIGETFATFARRLPPKERSQSALSRDTGGCSQENVLATAGRLFQQRQRRQETSRYKPQWFITASTAAASVAGTTAIAATATT